MLRSLKNLTWAALGRVLCAGYASLARRPAPATADGWRAAQLSYSHLGEDLLLLHLLRDRIGKADRGVHIDVGAFHPILFSNTYLLYQHGWTGINLDANPDRIGLFQRLRPRDTSMRAVLSDRAQDMDYLYYPTDGLNRIVPAGSADTANSRGEEPIRSERVRTCTLTEVLSGVLPAAAAIDLLSIDCEGHDLNVLAGLDWECWLPQIVAVEGNTAADREALTAFLTARGYRLVAVHLVTLIFAHGQVTDFHARSELPCEKHHLPAVPV
jgi:FkbM family methyltransferase